MNKAYPDRTYWKNEPSAETPLNENNLNRISAGLDLVDDRVIELNSSKMSVIEANKMAEKLREEINKLAADPERIRQIVYDYMNANTVEGVFTPTNIVLFEKSDEEEITAESIIVEVIKKLEFKKEGDNGLALYAGDVKITSIMLEEFVTNEVLCKGITLSINEITGYGNCTKELIAYITPSDCTQKVRWISDDETIATVTNGTVRITGKVGSTDITVVCGNYQAVCTVTISEWIYPEIGWRIGMVDGTIGGTGEITDDSQGMRIASDLIEIPIKTNIIMTGGSRYFYTIYYYKDGVLVNSSPAWAKCSETLTIDANEYSAVRLKIRMENYETWSDESISTFASTITLKSA